jgi:carboxyl-terminal processing protease
MAKPVGPVRWDIRRCDGLSMQGSLGELPMTRRLPLLLVILVLVGHCLSASLLADQSEQPKDDYYELYRLLVDTLEHVEQNYVKEVSRRELVEAAIRGALRELDPYSAYISPKQLDQFRTTVRGNFGGIGIQVGVVNGRLQVLSPLVGTPAYRAGVLAGDRIVEIDGKSAKGITIEEAVTQIKGKPGSKVTLTVIHPERPEPAKIPITREIIHVETVLGDHRKADDHWDFMLDPQKRIGYVRVTSFSRETAQDLKEALSELKRKRLRGLILDLRFNPGGLLSSAVDVSDLFLSQGKIVGTSRRASAEPSWKKATKERAFEGFRMVVLVNRYTASASEIVAACLQDHQRAVVMGERTWGKGSVQNVIPLERDRSALKLTTASYVRPSGKNIHRFSDADEDDEWGVVPDQGYERKLTDAELIALVKKRRNRDVLRPKPPETTASGEPNQRAPEGAAERKRPASDEEAQTETPEPDQRAAGASDKPKPDAEQEGAPSEPSEPAPGPEEPAPKPDGPAPKPDGPAPKPGEPASEEAEQPPSEAEKQPSELEQTPSESEQAPSETEQPASESEKEEPAERIESSEPGKASSEPEEASGCVDPHLRMAIDYLSAELARAE